MTQDAFAEASGGKFDRVEANNAANGRNQYKTDKWIEGIATAVGGARVEDVLAWRSGALSAAELVRRAREPRPPRYETLERLLHEHKDDFTLADQEELRAQAFSDGRDRTEAEWLAKRDELRARRRGKAVDVAGGDTDDASHGQRRKPSRKR